MTAVKSRNPTIRMVSDAAGVSTATVSRVLNNSPIPTNTTRQRVLEAASAIGYAPDSLLTEVVRHRRGKPTRKQANLPRTQIVALLTNRRVYDEYHSPRGFYSQAAWGLEEGLRAQDYHLIWSAVDERQVTLPPSVAQRRVDGIVIEGDLPPALLDLLIHRLPTVLISRLFPGVSASSVVANLQQAMYEQLAMLWGLGHRRIACFRTRGDLSYQRNLGEIAYREFFSQQGQPIPCPSLFEPYDINVDTHEQVIQQYVDELLKMPNRPTAIVCGDHYARSILEHVQARGGQVPEDLSIAGLHDEMNVQTRPTLSSFHFATEEIEQPNRPKRHLQIDGCRVKRDSCGPPAKALLQGRWRATES